MNKHIFWISSYPKSGNTLLRSILISLFFTKNGDFNFEMFPAIIQFESSSHVFQNKILFKNDYKKINDLSIFYKYILKLQEKDILKFNQDFKFLKTHSGNFSIGNNPFTKKENIRGFIYIIRDPRDICLSWANHSRRSVDESIDFMTNDTQSLEWKGWEKYFSKNDAPLSFLSSWEKHVISWTKTNWNIPIMIIKYENLINNKEKTIIDLADFFSKNYGFKFDNLGLKIKNIIKSTDFQIFKKEEKQNKFIEAPKGVNFFSKGKSNQWKKKLHKKQLLKIERKFNKIMKSYKYEISS